MTIIQATNLCKRVQAGANSLTILDSVNFTLNNEEAVAVTGPSGSGKSTLLSLLAGLDEPSDGEIHLLGQPLHELDEDGRAEVRATQVGFVFQSFQLLPGLTALENVLLPLELTSQSNARERAQAQLRLVGLDARETHLPSQLSGGEQQRVALARAFVTRPRVLFADEPTGNLDSVTGNSIVELMFAMRADQGCALVLVTHDQALATQCDRVLNMQQGRLK